MKVDSSLQPSSYMDDQSQSGGEDDLDFASDYMDSRGCHGGSKADMRKSNKPIMEKRRRARINNCLNELKGILLEAMRKDPARHSKLEKADILELTVRHLQNVQRNQLAIAMATDPTVLHRFKNGFSECATEVSRYLGRLDGVETGIRQRLTGHLGSCVNGLQQVGPMSFGAPRNPYGNPSMGMTFAVPPSPVTPNTHGLHPSAPIPSDHPSAGLVTSPVSAVQPSSLGMGVSGDLNNNTHNRFVLTSPSASSTSTVTSSNLNFEIHRSNITNISNRLASAFESASSNLTPLIKTSSTPPPSPPPVIDGSGSLSYNGHLGYFDSGPGSGSCSAPGMDAAAQHPNEKGTNTTPVFRLGKPKVGSGTGTGTGSGTGIGTPLDFSLSNKVGGKGKREGRERDRGDRDRDVRVGKVEPMIKSENDSAGARDSMWRPW